MCLHIRLGEIFQRDHTTVLHGWRAISVSIAKDAEMRAQMSDKIPEKEAPGTPGASLAS